MGFRRKNVLVLGAGYAGIQAVAKMQSLVSRHELDITLINRHDYHYESTWLHEVAAGAIDWHEATYYIRQIADGLKTNFVEAEVLSIHKDEKRVSTSKGDFTYDILIVALGFESETFGIPGMAEHAHSIVTPQTATAVYEDIERNFRRYLETGNEDLLSIIVGGGGFTGFEFIGELTDTIPSLCNELGIDSEKVRITCVEAAPVVLPMFSERLVQYAKDFLKEHDVELLVDTPITGATEEGILVTVNGEEKLLRGANRIWTAGVRGNKIMEEAFDGVKRGRIVVKEDLTIEGYPEIFVIGDVAAVMDGQGENARPYPTTAQIAMQMGEHTAYNIRHMIQGEEPKTFVFNNRGTVCSLGPKDGIGVALGREVTGSRAAMMKRIIDTRSIFKVGGPFLAFARGKMLNL